MDNINEVNGGRNGKCTCGHVSGGESCGADMRLCRVDHAKDCPECREEKFIHEWRTEATKGHRRKLIEKMKESAIKLFEVLVLEQSGIRDGDGYWHGSDVLGHYVADIQNLYRYGWKAGGFDELPESENEKHPFSDSVPG